MNSRSIISLSALLLLAGLTGCTSDTPDVTTTEVESTVTSGVWKITYFYDTDKEETAHFNGYEFTFGEDGTLTASNGASTVTGTWSVTDNSDDDSPSNPDFNIFFASPDDFEDLSDDWDIISRTDTKIELQDVSGGNGGTDDLIFEKL